MFHDTYDTNGKVFVYIEGNINIYIVVIYVGGGGIYVMKIWIMYMACLLYAYVDIQIIVGYSCWSNFIQLCDAGVCIADVIVQWWCAWCIYILIDVRKDGEEYSCKLLREHYSILMYKTIVAVLLGTKWVIEKIWEAYYFTMTIQY